jgi:hypothetical protein
MERTNRHLNEILVLFYFMLVHACSALSSLAATHAHYWPRYSHIRLQHMIMTLLSKALQKYHRTIVALLGLKPGTLNPPLCSMCFLCSIYACRVQLKPHTKICPEQDEFIPHLCLYSLRVIYAMSSNLRPGLQGCLLSCVFPKMLPYVIVLSRSLVTRQ